MVEQAESDQCQLPVADNTSARRLVDHPTCGSTLEPGHMPEGAADVRVSVQGAVTKSGYYLFSLISLAEIHFLILIRC
jgi:hypothetical protein